MKKTENKATAAAQPSRPKATPRPQPSRCSPAGPKPPLDHNPLALMVRDRLWFKKKKTHPYDSTSRRPEALTIATSVPALKEEELASLSPPTNPHSSPSLPQHRIEGSDFSPPSNGRGSNWLWLWLFQPAHRRQILLPHWWCLFASSHRRCQISPDSVFTGSIVRYI